jgi:hypothetical protein
MESSSALSAVSAGLELGSSRESFPDSFDRQRGATLGRQSRHHDIADARLRRKRICDPMACLNTNRRARRRACSTGCSRFVIGAFGNSSHLFSVITFDPLLQLREEVDAYVLPSSCSTF